MKTSDSTSGPGALHAIAVGAICGLLAIVQSIGFGSLLASGQPPLAAVAIGMALFSTVVLAAITPLFSSTPGVISITQGVSTVALAGLVGPITATMGGASTESVVATVVVAAGVSTLAVGATALLLGIFRLGRFIRFTPFPVIGGFLAGSGWLILRGGLDLIAGLPIAGLLGGPIEMPLIAKFAFAAVFIATVLALGRVVRSRLLFPAGVAAAIALFNLVAWAGGMSGETLSASGWILSLPSAGSLWPPIAPADVQLADWHAILIALEYLPSAVVLTIAALLMNATGIELDAHRDIDLDHELRSVGIANLAAGAGGGLPGFHALSLTLLASRLGAHGRVTGLTVSAMCLCALVFGGRVLTWIPTPLLGAMLIWIGSALLVEWLFRAYFRLSLWEYLVVALIFIVIAFAGFAWGLFVGLIAALMLFVVEYGRVDIVRLFVTGRDYQSSVDTSEERRQSLHVHGEAILIMRLQGFLFFGTADRLRQRVEQRAAGGDARTRFVLIDFRRVTGLDSSTVLSFVRLSQTATRERFTIVFTGVSDATRVAMLRGGLDVGEDAPIRFIADIDAGLKWCEDALLSEAAPHYVANASRPLASRLTDILNDTDFASKVAAYCERLEIAAGERLIEQGTPSADIFFVESGHASVAVTAKGHADVRLATVGPGAIIGEIAFYLGEKRSASVLAEEDMVVWRFSRDSIERLQREMPDVGLRFHEGIAVMLAKRLTRTNHLVRLLAD